jgi:hypothetical protein
MPEFPAQLTGCPGTKKGFNDVSKDLVMIQIPHEFAVGGVFMPPLLIASPFGAVMFLNIISVQNQQTYNFASFANTIVMTVLAIEELFQNWSDTPSTEPDGELQNRLAARLTEMETRINQTLGLVEQGGLGEDDYENFYRLIGSYRDLSESVVAHAKLARGIDWAQWEKARFYIRCQRKAAFPPGADQVSVFRIFGSFSDHCSGSNFYVSFS